MQASEKQISYLNWLRSEIEKFPFQKYPDIAEAYEDIKEKISEALKSNSLTKEDASDYIESLKTILQDLKSRFESEISEIKLFTIECKECGEITKFLGTLHDLKNYWACSCGSTNFEIKNIISKREEVIE